MRNTLWLAVAAAPVCAALFSTVTERDALACGGCFTPPEESESVITDEKMVLSISMTQTTLYDQINYSGSPASFAWVLPIKGTVQVGLSADVMFQVLNSLTTTEVLQPPTDCPAPPTTCNTRNAEVPAAAEGEGSTSSGGVTVTAQKQVGPYETVQLRSTDGSALNAWLTQHGYNIPADTKPVIDAYVMQHFDFLALKLIPGKGVQSMQPVRVTSQGAAPSLPLHMVAVGTGPTTGITIWVVADGRWGPSNFPTFTIADSEIAWDWAMSSSNYETLRLSKEAALNGRGWQIESSLELAQSTMQQTLLQSVEYGQQGGYVPAGGADAGTTDAGIPDASKGSGTGSGAGSSAGSSTATDDGDAGESSNEQMALATADLAVLFSGIAPPNVRITRMRSDVARAALSVDMALEASSDQSELTNIHTPGQQIGEPACPVYSSDGCEQTGTAPRSEAQALASAESGGGGGGGCSTTPPPSRARTTLAFLLAVGGAVAFRLRQKRRESR